MCVFEANGCGDTCELICSACSFECSLPRLIARMKNSVHPAKNYMCLLSPLLKLVLLFMHGFCFHVSFIILSSPVAPDIHLKTTFPETVLSL